MCSLFSRFFCFNWLIKKVAQSFFDANKAQHIRVACVNAFQSKNLAIVNISRLTFGSWTTWIDISMPVQFDEISYKEESPKYKSCKNDLS